MTVENPNVKSIWTTIEVDKDGVETVLVVETDLELNAADPAFDVAKVDALIEAAMKSRRGRKALLVRQRAGRGTIAPPEFECTTGPRWRGINGLAESPPVSRRRASRPLLLQLDGAGFPFTLQTDAVWRSAWHRSV